MLTENDYAAVEDHTEHAVRLVIVRVKPNDVSQQAKPSSVPRLQSNTDRKRLKYVLEELLTWM